MKVLIATHNPAKLKRYQNILSGIKNLNIVSLKDLKISQKIDEPHAHARENAIHKAKEYATLSSLPTIAIDEMVNTNFLPNNEQPGVYVRRIYKTNKEASDYEVLKYWQEIFKKYPQDNKKFIWDFYIAYCFPNKPVSISSAKQEYYVANEFSKKINEGYPMSSFFVLKGSNKPYSEYRDKEKYAFLKKTFAQFISEFKKWYITNS